MCERDLMDGDLLRVESAQDFEERRAAIRGVRAHALVENRCPSHTGGRPRDLEGPDSALLERLVAGNPDGDDVRTRRGLHLGGTPPGAELTRLDHRDPP